jgi:hypothetical protein
MNQKISEVTKLYDQLLDQQLSHHRWRPEAPVLNTYPARSDSFTHSAMWQTPSNVQQAQVTQPAAQEPSHLQMSPVQHMASAGSRWSATQGQPAIQPWLGQQQQLQTSNSSVVTSPVNQLAPQLVPVNVPPIQYQTRPSIPQQTVPQEQIIPKPPTASPAFVSPPSSTIENVQSQHPHLATTPVVRPIVQSSPSAYVPQNNFPPQQTAVPLFPSVPQTDPQLSYSSHAPEPERREALLIDL